MLLELVEKKNNEYFVFTSNIDGQFQKAGFNNYKLIRINPRDFKVSKSIGFSILYGGFEGLQKVLSRQSNVKKDII